jgi:hypothetical protein
VAPTASAAINGDVTVFPSNSYTVGAPASTTVVINHASDGLGLVDVGSIDLYAACSETTTNCDFGVGNDPGSFTFGPSGQGAHSSAGTAISTGCVGTWTINDTGEGRFRLNPPTAPMQLFDGTQCTITFPGTALRLPAIDTEPDPGLQTYFNFNATFSASMQTDVRASTYNQTTVNLAPPAQMATATPASAGPTGKRAAALAACAKKKSKKKRKKCRKAALLLPV